MASYSGKKSYCIYSSLETDRSQNLNSDPESQLRAVGRITIVREPSPIILGALHLTMNQDFDMDELFGYLEKEETSAVSTYC